MLGQSMNLGRKSIEITACVLPGQDPKEEYEKECQDNLFFTKEDEALLAVLFDGHGNAGKKVVDFCANFMSSFFRTFHTNFKVGSN